MAEVKVYPEANCLELSANPLSSELSKASQIFYLIVKAQVQIDKFTEVKHLSVNSCRADFKVNFLVDHLRSKTFPKLNALSLSLSVADINCVLEGALEANADIEEVSIEDANDKTVELLTKFKNLKKICVFNSTCANFRVLDAHVKIEFFHYFPCEIATTKNQFPSRFLKVFSCSSFLFNIKDFLSKYPSLEECFETGGSSSSYSFDSWCAFFCTDIESMQPSEIVKRKNLLLNFGSPVRTINLEDLLTYCILNGHIDDQYYRQLIKAGLSFSKLHHYYLTPSFYELSFWKEILKDNVEVLFQKPIEEWLLSFAKLEKKKEIVEFLISLKLDEELKATVVGLAAALNLYTLVEGQTVDVSIYRYLDNSPNTVKVVIAKGVLPPVSFVKKAFVAGNELICRSLKEAGVEFPVAWLFEALKFPNQQSFLLYTKLLTPSSERIQGQSIYHLAAEHSDFMFMEFLLRSTPHHQVFFIRDQNEKSVMDVATPKNFGLICTYLREKGLKVEVSVT